MRKQVVQLQAGLRTSHGILEFSSTCQLVRMIIWGSNTAGFAQLCALPFVPSNMHFLITSFLAYSLCLLAVPIFCASSIFLHHFPLFPRARPAQNTWCSLSRLLLSWAMAAKVVRLPSIAIDARILARSIGLVSFVNFR